MVSRVPKPRQGVAERRDPPRPRILLALAILAITAGCSSTDGMGVFLPYRGALAAEEYCSPPVNDARYTQPPSYPSHLLKPVFKQREDDSGPRRPVIGGGTPGMMPMQ
jgi:hypothetical protein